MKLSVDIKQKDDHKGGFKTECNISWRILCLSFAVSWKKFGSSLLQNSGSVRQFLVSLFPDDTSVISDPADPTSYAVTWVFPPFPPTCTLFLFPLPRQPSGICSIYSTSVHSPSDHLLCFFPSVPVIFSFCLSVACYDPLSAFWTPACLPQPLLDKCVSSPAHLAFACFQVWACQPGLWVMLLG